MILSFIYILIIYDLILLEKRRTARKLKNVHVKGIMQLIFSWIELNYKKSCDGLMVSESDFHAEGDEFRWASLHLNFFFVLSSLVK